jgi:hypothetical protein
MSDESIGCITIISVIIVCIVSFLCGIRFASSDDIFYEKRTQCETALNQERCVDTLIYVTKPYTKYKDDKSCTK